MLYPKIERKTFYGLCFLVFGLLFFVNCVYAGQDITLVFTGQTHGMLYPCQCPVEADGGIARRATKIKELRRSNPNIIVLDSGNFFAGGAMDEYSQNTELDKTRTLINLSALKMMGYDALGVADDEFNFTSQFLGEQLDKIGIPLLSCNVRWDRARPFILKDLKGIKIGILAVTSPNAKPKAVGLDISPAMSSVSNTVVSLKKSGVDVIILLSSLSSDDNLRLVAKVPAIDIIIGNFPSAGNDLYFKKNSTLIFMPMFQGKRLGKATLLMDGKNIKEVEFEEIRLSDQVKDDKDILSILPRCFSDTECKKDKLVGYCQEAGKPEAVCLYAEAKPIPMYVIEPADCRGCNSQGLIKTLKNRFPGLQPAYIKYPGDKSRKMIEELKIETLPAYIVAKEIEAEKDFDVIKINADLKESFYVLKTALSGIALYLNRERIEGKFDILVSVFNKDTPKLLAVAREFKPEVHFLVVSSERGFEANGGIAEVEECLRGVCVGKYYPDFFWDYLTCRSGRATSSWWEDCFPDNIDVRPVSKCARSKEGTDLLEKNIALNKELQVLYGPVYLVNNQEMYGGKGAPSKDELKTIIKK